MEQENVQVDQSNTVQTAHDFTDDGSYDPFKNLSKAQEEIKPVVEEVKAPETTVEDNSSLNTPEVKTQETVESNVVTEEKVTTEEQVSQFIEDEIAPGEILNILNEAVKTEFGFNSYSEALEFKSKDYNNVEQISELDVLIEATLFRDPETTEKEISVLEKEYDVLFWDKEKVDEAIEEGKLTQKEYDRLDAKFSRELRQAREFLKSEQEKIDLDSLRISRKVKAQEEDKGNSEEIAKQFTSALSEKLSKGMVESYTIKDKNGKDITNVSFTVGENEKQSILNSDPSNIYSRWINQDGSFNLDKFSSDINLLVNKEQIHSAIYSQGLAAGIEKQLKEINNIDFKGNAQTAPVEVKKSLTEQMGF